MSKWHKIAGIIGILILVCGCARIKSKYEAIKARIAEEIDAPFRTDFYSDYGAWDYYRVPLIAPYEITAIDTREVWSLEKRRNIDKFDYYPNSLLSARLSVEYVGISDSIIYLSYTDELTPVDKLPGHTYGNREMRQYAIVDVPTDSIEWHETREDWLAALNRRNIINPQLYQVDSLYDDFANNMRLLFNPNSKIMKLTDKRFWIFEALSLVCGELTFCIAAGIWFALSQVNWFSEWTIQCTILVCWASGALLSWLTAKNANNITFRTYIWTNCVYLALTIYNVFNGDESINGWFIMFGLGCAIVSLPAFILMTIIYAKINQITDGIKAIGLVLLTALPLVVINFMGRNLGIGKVDMIKDVANEVIGMVDNFKDKNGRLPIGLNEIGTPFEGINETYEYKGYIFYYEPREDGFYWLTITFGPDENYCYESKNKSWIWDCDSNGVEMYKKFDIENDFGDETDR